MNNSKPLVSVIVPVYNTEDYIQECLNSIINQSLSNIEIILVNDGSTDGSLEILEDYAKKDTRIKIINKDNEGQAIAKNLAISKSNGKYLSFIDSDDYIDLNAYEKIYNYAESNNNDIVLFNVLRFNKKNTWKGRLHRISIPNENIPSTNIINFPNLVYDSSASNKLIKKSFWDNYCFKFEEGRFYEDLLVAARLYCCADSIGIFSNVNYYWRIRENQANKSTTQKLTDTKNFNDRIFILNKITDLYREKNENLLKYHYKKCLDHDFIIILNKINESSQDLQCEIINKINLFLEDIF
ncbi:glycosyltransferase [Methanobrevibacter arboriphilus]|nr:glycosyltransferase [Methanobrevibacter arboriphilus]